MNSLRDALPQYVALKSRALGTKLQEPARTLEHFWTSSSVKDRVHYIRTGTPLGHRAARCPARHLGAAAAW